MPIDDKWYEYFRGAFEDEDPWGFSSSTYELTRYHRQNFAIKQYQRDPSLILELGCAEGAHTELLLREFQDAEVVAVDFVPSAVERASSRIDESGCHFVRSDFSHFVRSADAKFDVIILSELLYTMGDTMTVSKLYSLMDDIVGLLSPGGVLCMSNIVGYRDSAIETLTERPIIDSYRTMLSGLAELVFQSEHEEYKRESDNLHKYEIWLFRKTRT